MNDIKVRENYDEYDPIKKPYIEYEIVDQIPENTDFVSKENRTIILKNKETGELEKLNYCMIGGVPDMIHKGYLWYYGQIVPECGMDLVFNFDYYGRIKSIVATFCAPTPRL